MNLTDEQQYILDRCEENIYVSASPGSGKSTMLGKICEKLLLNEQNKVMLITFTNKAAKSIISKCDNLDGDRIIGGTFHSISYRFMKQNNVNLSICDENKKRLIIKKLFRCKTDKAKVAEIYDSISLQKSKWPYVPDEQCRLYDKELRKYNLMDFDDIIYIGISMISNNELAIPGITHILVDELQDTSGPQLEFLRMLQNNTKCNMIGCSDDDQCHPSGNKILTTDGYIDIKDINPKKHKVPAYDGHGKIYGNTKPNGYSIEKSSRLFTGNLFTFSTWFKDMSCTYNHKCYVKWNYDKTDNIHVTYLMKKDKNFRIGQCKLFTNHGFHLGTRSRLEDADSAWILSIHTSRRDALIQEAILATKFRIPTIRFQENNTSINFKQENIDYIFNELNAEDMKKEANKLLKYYNRNIDFPLWIKSEYAKQGRRTFFVTQACNIIPNIMMFGFHVHPKDRYLKLVEVQRIKVNYVENEQVFSLNVKKFHNYICNNVLVSNSIYSWRGARPENVRDFISYFNCSVLNMGYNFRSSYRVVETSKTLIENNKNRIDKLIRAWNTEKGFVSAYRCQNHIKEIDYAISICKRNRNKKISILYRNRLYKNHLEFELRKNGLDYCINDFLEITDRTPIRVMLSCLRIASDNYDIYDLEQASKAIKRLGKGTIDKISNECKEKQISTRELVLEWYKHKTKWKPLQHIQSIQKEFRTRYDSKLSGLVKVIEEHFVKSFNFQDDMRSFLIDITSDIKVGRGTINELYNELGLNSKNDEDKKKDSNIELSTVHGFKGLESDIVIIPWCNMFCNPKPGQDWEEEDERRLFYVAVTRAKSMLYISYSGEVPQFINEMKI